MSLDKTGWIEAIDSKLKEIGDGQVFVMSDDDAVLQTMTKHQLAWVEMLIARIEHFTCGTGCGECEVCKAQNVRAAERAAVCGKRLSMGTHYGVIACAKPASHKGGCKAKAVRP